MRTRATPRAPGTSALIGALGDAAPVIHPQAWVAPGAVVVGKVSIGRASSIWYGAVLRADNDQIAIGEACNIQDLCCVHVDAGEPVLIESRVTVGHHATIHGAHLEAGSLIGMGAVILGGSRIGAGAIVAAGTVVLGGTEVPAGVLYAGVPGRVVRERTDHDRQRFAQGPDQYAERARQHRSVRWYNRTNGDEPGRQ
jgi:carbonic anhydrase/acetyltransferase-like protein (isoleucine patch superfamily)